MAPAAGCALSDALIIAATFSSSLRKDHSLAPHMGAASLKKGTSPTVDVSTLFSPPTSKTAQIPAPVNVPVRRLA